MLPAVPSEPNWLLAMPYDHTVQRPPAPTASAPRLLMKLPAMPASSNTSPAPETTRALAPITMPCDEAPVLRPLPAAKVISPLAETFALTLIRRAPVIEMLCASRRPLTPATVPISSVPALLPNTTRPVAFEASVPIVLAPLSPIWPAPDSSRLLAVMALPAPCEIWSLLPSAALINVSVLPLARLRLLSRAMRLKSNTKCDVT